MFALEKLIVVSLDNMLRQKHQVDEALEAEDAAVGKVVHAAGVHHHEVGCEDHVVAGREAAHLPDTNRFDMEV
jgi:hypothetical protein